jgi:hypothetical protein
MSDENVEHWAVSRDGEHYDGEYATPEEAAACAEEHFDVEPGDTVYVGRAVPLPWEQWVDGEIVIDRLQEYAYDAVGEYAEDWLATVSPEASRALNARLRATVGEWLREFGHLPGFYSIEDDRPMTVPVDEVPA